MFVIVDVNKKKGRSSGSINHPDISKYKLVVDKINNVKIIEKPINNIMSLENIDLDILFSLSIPKYE